MIYFFKEVFIHSFFSPLNLCLTHVKAVFSLHYVERGPIMFFYLLIQMVEVSNNEVSVCSSNSCKLKAQASD